MPPSGRDLHRLRCLEAGQGGQGPTARQEMSKRIKDHRRARYKVEQARKRKAMPVVRHQVVLQQFDDGKFNFEIPDNVVALGMMRIATELCLRNTIPIGTEVADVVRKLAPELLQQLMGG